MAENDGDTSRLRAEELVADSERGLREVRSGVRRDLVNAVTKDLTAADEATGDSEARLAKLEMQTQVLAEAVLAITDTSPAMTTAVQAVKDEM
jgi:hypothetical protein